MSGSFAVGLSNDKKKICPVHLENYVFVIGSSGGDSWFGKPEDTSISEMISHNDLARVGTVHKLCSYRPPTACCRRCIRLVKANQQGGHTCIRVFIYLQNVKCAPTGAIEVMLKRNCKACGRLVRHDLLCLLIVE